MAYLKKEDQRDAARRHYERNMEAMKARARVYTTRKIKSNKRFVDAVKSYPCQDCGSCYPPYVMDLDHLNDKVKNVSACLAWSTARLIDEVLKCDLVCSNCHRERTFKRSESS